MNSDSYLDKDIVRLRNAFPGNNSGSSFPEIVLTNTVPTIQTYNHNIVSCKILKSIGKLAYSPHFSFLKGKYLVYLSFKKGNTMRKDIIKSLIAIKQNEIPFDVIDRDTKLPLGRKKIITVPGVRRCGKSTMMGKSSCTDILIQ